MKKEKQHFTNQEILEDIYNIHLILDDKGLSIMGDKTVSHEQLYSLIIIKTYQSYQYMLNYFTYNNEFHKIIENQNNFFDVYNILKKEYHQIIENIQEELKESDF